MNQLNALIERFISEARAQGIEPMPELLQTFDILRGEVRTGVMTETDAVEAFELALGLADVEVSQADGLQAMVNLALRQGGRRAAD